MVNLIVCPASGANFISQLVILQHLCEVGYKPDLCLGSSGGNLVLYIAAAADYHWPAIQRIAKELKPTFFCQPWNGSAPLAAICGFFAGHAFDKGKGLTEFLESHFTPQTIMKYQIITGTYNKDLQKIRLFFNCCEHDSIIDPKHFDYDITESQPPCFMAGDFDLIATAGLASASIPGLVPPPVIEGHHYSDGASSINSPMTIIQNALLKSLKCNDTLHITYVNCKNLAQANLLPHHNLFDTWKQAVNDLIKSQTLIDRLAAFDTLKAFAKGDMKKRSFPCDYDHMQEVQLLRTKVKYTLLEIYPTVSSDLDITNFTSMDIERNMALTQNQCLCHLWWYE